MDRRSRARVPRVRRRARRYDRANDPQMRAPANGFEAGGMPLVARLQTTLGWLSGPATVRLPDDAAFEPFAGCSTWMNRASRSSHASRCQIRSHR